MVKGDSRGDDTQTMRMGGETSRTLFFLNSQLETLTKENLPQTQPIKRTNPHPSLVALPAADHHDDR